MPRKHYVTHFDRLLVITSPCLAQDHMIRAPSLKTHKRLKKKKVNGTKQNLQMANFQHSLPSSITQLSFKSEHFFLWRKQQSVLSS